MINNLPRLNPEQYAQKYAQDNNVSISQARIDLESQFGKPQPPQAPQQSQGGAGNAYAGMDIFDKMDILNQHFSQEEAGSAQAHGQNPFLDLFQQMLNFFAPANDAENQGFDREQQPAHNQIPQDSISSNTPENKTETPKEEKSSSSKDKKQNPDQVAKEYMEQYNKENPNDTITLDEAKELLAEKYGKPEEQK